jgi:hypothetical protein
MKVKYAAPKKTRIKDRFISIETVLLYPDYWWDMKEKKWILMSDIESGHAISNMMSPCRSVKAFKRRLHQWSSYLPKGIKFRLISRYIGYDVYGKTK